MKLRDHFEGRGDPFEGDRTIAWRSLPANALVTKATLTVEPRLPPGSSAYIETLRFAGGGAYGATVRAAAAETAEIDFHARRTPVAFTGLTPKTSPLPALSVDIGGNVYLSVSEDGTIPRTTGNPYKPGSSSLPGIGASRIRLANYTNVSPNNPAALEAVTVDIATMPSNITLRFGKRLPFWFKTGDLASPTTTPDITDAVKLAIADAPVVNGFYAIPLVVHSDTLGRVAITLEVEYFGVAPLLPAGLREVVMAYDYASTAKQDASALQAILPAGAAIVPELTSLQLRGAFDASRIAYGPTGTTTASETVRCSASATLAQPVVPSLDINVTAIDLFVAADGPAARLALDLRADFDGKPSQNSLLAKPVPFDLEGDATGQLRWTSVPLDPPALLRAIPPTLAGSDQPKRYWVVVQAIDGAAYLGIDADTPERRRMSWGTNSRQSRPPLLDPEKPPQHSTNAGFSWRDAPPFLLRMRTVPGRFTMPIEFAAGGDVRRASLDRYDPLGKIDAVINEPAIAAAVQTAVLDATPPSCPRGELLENGDFALWRGIGTALGSNSPLSLGTPTTGGLSSIVVADTFFNKAVIRPLQLDFPQLVNVVFSSDGASVYVATSTGIHALDAVSLAITPLKTKESFNPKDIAADPRSALLYGLSADGLQAFDPVVNAPSGNSIPFTGARALALAGDGRKAYVATFETFSAIIAIDLVTGMQGWRIPGSVAALALTPDGATIFTMDTATRQIACYDTAGGTMRWSIALPQNRIPRAIAAAVDGSGVYVVGAISTSPAFSPLAPADTALLALDMRGRVAQSVALPTMGGLHMGLAVKPQGDQLYVADVPLAIDPAGQHLVAISPVQTIVAVPIGDRRPVAWTLTAGSVAPHRSSEPPTIGGAAIENGALSQVIAVAPGCINDFAIKTTVSSPDGVASTAAEAFAELFWLDAAGALLDSVELPLPPSSRAVKQSRRVQSPPASAQAEVRIRVVGGTCIVRSVSLQAADGAIEQDAWRAEANPQAIRISARDNITTYQNLGAAEVALAQTVMLTKSVPYEMDFRGSASGDPAAAPYFELRYRDANGAYLGDAARVALDPLGFSRRPAALLPPAAATSAQIRMVLPRGASISAESVQLVPRPVTAVPCTFIAQSPGEVHVSNAQIVYEWRPGPRPAPPAGGLNPPTPPGSTPGDASCCDPCGETDAAAADLRAVAAFSVLSANVSPAGMLAAVIRTEFDAPLTSIIGIAAARERRLNAAGILTLRDLAAATPAQVVTALEGTVAPTPELAIILIGRARTALGMQPDEQHR
ncbi:MAG: hypothetical protein WCE79_13035 [Xanthobacteraceae bacterium]